MSTQGMPQIIRRDFMAYELSWPSTQIIEYKADKIIAETMQLRKDGPCKEQSLEQAKDKKEHRKKAPNN